MEGARFVVRRHDPRRWRFAAGVGLLSCALLAYGLFELGRRAGGYSAISAAREEAAMTAEIRRLEEENAMLKTGIARLETSREIDLEAQRRLQDDLLASTSEVAELNEELAFYRRIMAPPDGEHGLRVQAFDVIPAAEPGHFRLKLVLVQSRQRDSRTSGGLDVEFSGTLDGEATRMSLVDLAAGGQTFDFRYFQDIDLEVALPTGFRPDSAMVVLTPKGRDATPVSASFPWNPGT